jgi:peptidoglycan/LPS O-acetylase OafA/YrhL
MGTLFSPAVSHIISGIAYTLPFFVGGVLTYSICQYVGLKWEVAAVSAALLLILMIFGSSQYVFSIFGAYLIVLVGSKPNIGSKFAERFGDISYGMYLFGWPLEQLVKQYTQTNNAWVLMLISFPLAAGIAGISYHAVEKPALRLKKPLSLLADSFLRSSGMAQHRLISISATLAFLASGAVILTDGDRWWFVTPSLANVALSSLAGATITWLIVKLYRQFLSPT